MQTKRKVRSDKKCTVQTRLTNREMVLFNRFKLQMDYRNVLETVNQCIIRGLEDGTDTYIDDDEITAIKARRVSDRDTVLVNGRIHSDLHYIFKYLQGEFNLNQRQLLYILIARIVERNGMDFREGE